MAEIWGAALAAAGAAASISQSQKNSANASKQQNEASLFEQSRQQQIDQTKGQINQVFDSPARQHQYGDYASALREYLGGELVRQKRDASRNLKFALAKAGQTGGSVAADSGARLGDEYTRAAIGNERTVQGDVASLRGQDEQSRNSLLALASSGLDATTGITRANEQLSTNLADTQNKTLVGGLGDAFQATAGTYKAINERAATRRGFGYKANRADLYG